MLSDGITFDWAAAWILGELVDEMTLGVALEVHRAFKFGITQLEQGELDETDSAVIDQPGLDVFGQSLPLKKVSEIVCPNCDRPLAASRFAPHLEKCMGMGRNSSRLASRRIASTTKLEAVSDDDFEDDEWIAEKKKKRKEKMNSPRRPKKLKATGSEQSLSFEDGTFDQLSMLEKKNVFSSICGVISEHTGRMCTKSLRCPQHTEEQRRDVRVSLGIEELDSSKEIDVDSWEQGDDPIAFLLGTEPPSPAESTSTTASTGSASSKRQKSKSKK